MIQEEYLSNLPVLSLSLKWNRRSFILWNEVVIEDAP